MKLSKARNTKRTKLQIENVSSFVSLETETLSEQSTAENFTSPQLNLLISKL